MSSAQPVTILREMGEQDRPDVLALFGEFIRHEAGLDPAIAPFVQDRTDDPDEAANYLAYCEALVGKTGGALVVALHRGEIAGFLCWSIGTDGPFVRPAFRRVGEIAFVMTGEGHRGQGIGKLLMAEAERLTRAAGCNRLSLMVMAGNRDAIRLYERLGFETRAYKMLKRV
ncbi:MAG: GNAT family N-acetyltransferase [Hyphomicrobiales bacterium]